MDVFKSEGMNMSWVDQFHQIDEWATKFGYDDLTISYDGINQWMVKLKDRHGNVILTGSGESIKKAVDDLWTLLDDTME